MEMVHIVVPNWMNVLSVPILIGMLLTLNYCTAVWMQPTRVPSMWAAGDATTTEIFFSLAVFSVAGLAVGLLAATIELPMLGSIALEVAALVALMVTLLPKKLWLVAGICYETSFFIGLTIVNYNAVYAFLLTIAMVIIILIMIITIGPLSFIKTR